MFRHTFRQPEHAAPLLRALLPRALATGIDWSSLALEPGTFVEPELRQRHSDVLFSARRRRGRRVMLYVLVEHKSSSERDTVLQLWRNLGWIWQTLWQQQPRPKRLPPIVPLVVHHGRHRWTAPRDLIELLDLRGFTPGGRRAFADLVPGFRYLLDSQHGRTEAELRGLALSALGALTLAVLQSVSSGRGEAVLDAFARFDDLLRRERASPSGQGTFVALCFDLLHASAVAPELLAEALQRHVGTEAETIMRTAADRLLAKGKAEGKAEGRTEGRVAMLLRLLTARFGEQPEALRSRLLAASVEQLDRWAERVLDAASVDDVFADG
jgi:predicted transposase YdaD